MLPRCRFLLILAVLGSPSLVQAGTSNSLMDVSPDSQRLMVANTDNGTVTVLEVASRKVLHEIKVGDKPEGVSWIGNGPQAVVANYRAGTVVLVDADQGKVLKTLKVAAEPYGVVTDKAGQRAWVSHEYPGLVSEIDLKTFEVKRTLKAGAFTRGIALSPDESRVYVSEFFTGILHALDLAKGAVVESWTGHSTDNLARHVLLHPTRPKAYVAHIRSKVTANDGAGSIFPQLAVCDLKPGEGRRRVSIAMDTFNGVYVTTNPWESAMSPDRKTFYLIYAGTNDMQVASVIDDDYKEVERIQLPMQVGQNPRAVRASADGKHVFVYNAMDFAVAFYQAPNMKALGSIKVCAEAPKTPEWVRGKVLFNTANAPMTSRRWIACSSCHPDGLHDGRVWHQPEGLRKTTALIGMAHTHPLHWSADRDEVQDFEYTIRSNLMQGRGLLTGAMKPKKGYHKVELEETTSGRSKDLDALAIYSNSFEFPLSPNIPAPGQLSPAAQRGKEHFFSKKTNCASCHSGPFFTDSRLEKPFKLHDVGTWTKADDPSEKMGSTYDTPTLLGIYRTAPYLHHGKAKTLQEVLTTHNRGDKHGVTSHLNKTEIDELAAFLLSLPYEPTPAMTPNTVKFRVEPK